MTDVLISAGELAELDRQGACRHHRYAQSRTPTARDTFPAPSTCMKSSPISPPRRPRAWQELKTKFADAFGAAGLSGKETAVIYEQSMNSGFGQSCRGYFLLTMLGYPKVKVLHGGFDAWAMPRACRSRRRCRRRRRHRSRSCRKPATS